MASIEYDEFGLFHENAEEAGLAWKGPPTVERVEHTLDDGRVMRALRWGSAPPQIVFLHGGGQNAHTWDTVALAIDRPMLAIDLPGHGHSDLARHDEAISPRSLAADMAPVIRAHAPDAALVVGMSLGGMTSIALTDVATELVRKLLLVDVTPGVNGDKASDVAAFLAGPESFASFDEILQRTIDFNPTRSESSLRRGILHNAVERDDGTWVWRHQRGDHSLISERRAEVDFTAYWDMIEAIDVPVQLVVGDRSPVVDEEDVAEFRRRQPDATVITVVDAGHSIQGDRPVELAHLIEEFLTT